jgi:hypothetical protein
MSDREMLWLVVVLGFALATPVVAQPTAPARLQVGDEFPRLEGEFLTGRTAVLPDSAQGKLALVLMGFTYQSRFQVEAWAEQVTPGFAAREDATFFEVPVIGGMARLGKWFIDSGMRRGTPKQLHENVITVWGGVDRWKARMGFSPPAKDDAYVALLGRDGRILWLHRGPPSESALEALMHAVHPAPRDLSGPG